MTPWAAVVAGVAAGSTHVVTGPDHIAAVLPLTVGRWQHSVRVGLLWGVGHAAGVITLALAGQLLVAWIDVERVGGVAEGLVGLLLIGLGVWTLGHARRGHVHTSTHTRGGSAAAFGFLHGLGGTGHLLGVLPTLALSPQAAAIYVAGYLTAAVLLMIGVAVIASAGWATPARQRIAMVAAGVLALGVGLFWTVTAVG